MTEQETASVQKPQVNISRSTQARMWLVCCCAFAAVLQSAAGDSGASLVIALCAVCAAVLAELLVTWKAWGFARIKDGSAAASALVFALLLPNQIYPVYAIMGALFAILVVKHSFGGLGSNWLNPALGAWLFIRFSWPGVFMEALKDSPLQIVEEALRSGGHSLNAPVTMLKTAGAAAENAFDAALTPFLNNTFFSRIGVELPAGYAGLLASDSPGIIADRGLLALLAGTVIITSFRIGRSWIPAAYLGAFGIMVYIAGDLPFGGLFRAGDILFALFSGGTIAAAFILASDPVSGAKSFAGVLIAAFLGGFLSWLFRYGGGENYGAFFAVALVNALNPAVRFLESRFFYSRRLKRGEETV